MKLFDKKSLKNILEYFRLQGPYWNESYKVDFAAEPLFGFGLWEVKTLDARGLPRNQTVRKMVALLRWQRQLFETAECEEFCPLVWLFSSIGSRWEVHGCYESKNITRSGEHQYVSLCFLLLLMRD